MGARQHAGEYVAGTRDWYKLPVVPGINHRIGDRTAGDLLVALRAGAPRSPALAGAAAGLLAGALAATLYASHCPDDSPLFVVLWYLPGMALVTLAGAAAGNGVLRW